MEKSNNKITFGFIRSMLLPSQQNIEEKKKPNVDYSVDGLAIVAGSGVFLPANVLTVPRTT